MSTPEDLARWLEEGRELLQQTEEQVHHLVQENERLRAELGRLDELAAENTRLRAETARLQAERDELLAAFSRMADMLEQARRRSRGGGVAG